jgi:hypothetical protein
MQINNYIQSLTPLGLFPFANREKLIESAFEWLGANCPQVISAAVRAIAMIRLEEHGRLAGRGPADFQFDSTAL